MVIGGLDGPSMVGILSGWWVWSIAWCSGFKVVDPTSLKRGDDRSGVVLCVVNVCQHRERGWSVGWNE